LCIHDAINQNADQMVNSPCSKSSVK